MWNAFLRMLKNLAPFACSGFSPPPTIWLKLSPALTLILVQQQGLNLPGAEDCQPITTRIRLVGWCNLTCALSPVRHFPNFSRDSGWPTWKYFYDSFPALLSELRALPFVSFLRGHDLLHRRICTVTYAFNWHFAIRGNVYDTILGGVDSPVRSIQPCRPLRRTSIHCTPPRRDSLHATSNRLP